MFLDDKYFIYDCRSYAIPNPNLIQNGSAVSNTNISNFKKRTVVKKSKKYVHFVFRTIQSL